MLTLPRAIVLPMFLTVLLIGLAGCETSKQPTQAVIVGTVNYRERVAMPTPAEVEIQLMDVTDGTDAATAVATMRMAAPSQLPLRYSLVYDPIVLRPDRRYAVQATIFVEGKPWYVTREVNHRAVEGRIFQADILLQPAR